MFQKRTSKKRQFYNCTGLLISTAYLALTFILKWTAFTRFEEALATQNISYNQIDTRPAPLNTILWSANVETDDAYLLGNYSYFDTKPISFNSYPKNHDLIEDILDNEKMQRMIQISEGWFTITQKNNNLYYNDLRFGLMSLEPNSESFVFQFLIEIDNKTGDINFIEQPKSPPDAKKLLSQLWGRIKGN